MSEDVILPAYVQSFTCIADKCEDTCCQGWDVRFDRSCYERLQTCLEEDNQGSLLQENVMLYSPDENTNFHAYIKMRDDGYCPFLTKTKTCKIHQQYGVDVLSDICAFYPRVINKVGDVCEVNGAMSCPEMVRNSIGAGLPEKYFINDTTDILPRSNNFTLQRQLDIETPDSYQQFFTQVRDAMYRLVRENEDDLMIQQYSLASYTSRISTFYFSGCSDLRKADFTRAYNQTVKEKGRYTDFLKSIESDNVFSESFLNSLIQTNISHSKNRKYSGLVNHILEARTELYDTYGVDSVFELNDSVQEQINNFIDNHLSVYLANCLYREWFTTLPNTFNFIFMIIVRLAMIRFLARLYIRLEAEKQASVPDENRLLEMLTEAVYLHARAVDHNIPYLQVVYQAMQEQDMFNIDFLLPLIKCN